MPNPQPAPLQPPRPPEPLPGTGEDELSKAAVPRLVLGRLLITANAATVLPDHEVAAALRRHAAKDWGHLSREDWTANEVALREGTRVLSSYRSAGRIVFWVITEADRSSTKVLLPEDY